MQLETAPVLMTEADSGIFLFLMIALSLRHQSDDTG